MLILIVLLYFAGLLLTIYLDARMGWGMEVLVIFWPIIIVAAGPFWAIAATYRAGERHRAKKD